MRLCAAALFGLTVAAAVASAEVSGRVVGPDGNPVGGASVNAYPPESPDDRAARLLSGRPRLPVATARTAPDGTFRLGAGEPWLALAVQVDGFAPAFTTAADGDAAALSLQRTQSRRGIIRADGRPLPGATVVWLQAEGPGLHGEFTVQTGPDGAYEVADPSSWAHQAFVLHPGYAPLALTPGALRAGTVLESTMDKGLPVEGSVVDERGAPVRDASVAVGSWPAWPLARTTATGRFKIAHTPRDWHVLHGRTAAATGSFTRKAGPIAIVARPTRSIAGFVRDPSGGPVAGAAVGIMDETGGTRLTVITDRAGKYAAEALPSGRFTVSASRAGFRRADDHAGDEPVELRAATRTARHDLTLVRRPVVSGRVQDEEGRPVDNAFVSLGMRGTPHIYAGQPLGAFGEADPSVRTAPDGSFSLATPDDEEAVHAMLKERPLVVLKPGYAAARLERPEGGAGEGRPVITLARGVPLEGRVTTDDGQPLAGVGVTLAEEGSVAGTLLPSDALLATVTGEPWTATDADGRFSVRVHPAAHHLSFRKPGHAPKVVRAYDGRRDGPLTVMLERAASVSGRVVHADGRGVPDAALSLSRAATMMDDGTETTTGADGAFTFTDLAPGTYELSASLDSLGFDQTRSLEAPAANVEFVVPRGATLRGRVVTASGRQPVTRYTLQLEWTGESEGGSGVRRQDVDDAMGAFSAADVAAGEVAVRIEAEGHAPRRIEGVLVTPGAEMPEVEIVLEAEIPIRGRVTGEGSGPLAGAQVSWIPEDRALSASTRTEDDGEYDLRGVGTGPATLQVSAQGFLSEKRPVDASQNGRLDVSLRRGLTLKGEVLRDGAGVPGAFVNANSSVINADAQSARTDARGAFTLEALVPGRYTLSAIAPGKGKATVKDVDVEASGPVRLLLQQPETAVLVGHVRGLGAAEATAMAAVSVQGGDGAMAQGIVDATHAFRIEDAPAGPVTVTAYAASADGTMRTSRPVEVTLVAGGEHETVVDFPADSVSGIVTRHGAPLPNATVSFQRQQATAVARTDARGAYEVVGVDPGSYSVSVSADGEDFTTEVVVGDSGQVDIDVTTTGVRGRTVAAGDGAPIPGVNVSLWRLGGNENTPATSVVTNARGEFSARALREGRYRVVTSKKGFGQEVREVEAVRGAAAEIVLELSAGTGLGVAVVDARDGRALEAIVVVRDAARRIVANRHAGADDDGIVTIPLSAGPYLLSTSANGYGTATVSVTAPAEGLRVALTPGGTLVLESARDLKGRVRLVQPDGEEYVQCWCNGIAEINLAGRRTAVEHVAPGGYTVELIDAKATVWSRAVTVLEGQVSTVVIE